MRQVKVWGNRDIVAALERRLEETPPEHGARITSLTCAVRSVAQCEEVLTSGHHARQVLRGVGVALGIFVDGVIAAREDAPGRGGSALVDLTVSDGDDDDDDGDDDDDDDGDNSVCIRPGVRAVSSSDQNDNFGPGKKTDETGVATATGKGKGKGKGRGKGRGKGKGNGKGKGKGKGRGGALAGNGAAGTGKQSCRRRRRPSTT
jgi:hypothetical protein